MATDTTATGRRAAPRERGIAVPGILLGVGLGGFLDGIVLHQLLQWHHMLSSHESVTTVEGLRANTRWDGGFHAFSWLCVVVALALLWSRATRSPGALPGQRALWGWALAGWGVFNLVEGLIDHIILRIHHVRHGPDELAWDIGFLVLGAVLVAAGAAIARGGAHRAER